MIKRIRPVTRVARIEGEVRRLVQAVLSEGPDLLELDGGWTLRLDLVETADALVAVLEAPGLTSRDIVISLHPSRLEVRGVKRESTSSGPGRFLRLEREYGRFRRTLPLPCAVVPEGAKAFLENGVLKIFMPKPKGRRERDRIVKIVKNTE
jgi:HSP20 family protein